VSVAFAATDDVNITEVDDEIEIDEDISLEGANDDVSESDTLQKSENDDVPEADTAQESVPVVTKDSFYNYFAYTGELLNNVTSDELAFEGDFTGVGVSDINIDKTIKLTGNNATFSGVSFVINADNVVFDGFNLAQNNKIAIYDATNVTVSNNVLGFESLDEVDGFAIVADNVNNLRLIDNTIRYVGVTDGSSTKNAIMITNSKGLVISGNQINATNPAGGGSVIYLEGCASPALVDNIINYKYDGIVGYGLTSVIQLLSRCDDALVSHNTISALGAGYVYGITVYGANFTIEYNNITVDSDIYYACGINPDAGASGVVKNNEINVTAPSSVYGIYSGMWFSSAPLVVDYIGNIITVDSFFACGIEIGGAKENVIGNYIVLKGNYTMGIGLYKYAQDTINTTISYNQIELYGTNVGDASTIWDSVGVETTGIKVAAGNVTVIGNNIESTAGGIYAAGDNIELIGNDITVETNEMVNNYAITANNVDDLTIGHNTISLNGKNNGTLSSNGIFMSNVGSSLISGNSLSVVIPAGGGSAIYLENCGAPRIQNNTIDFKYGEVIGYGSTNAIYLTFGCDDANICYNEITVLGADYVYGITVYGANFTIDNNYVTVISNVNYACAINPDAGASGVVKNNNIYVSAPLAAYGIYSGMWYATAPLVVDYVNNTVSGDGFFVCGIEIGGAKENVSANHIYIAGNYTIGVALYKYVQDTIDTAICDNEIVAMGTNVGDKSLVWDSIGVETTGIKVAAGNITISGNDVKTSGDYAIVIGDASGIVSNNTLAAKFLGANAIKVNSDVEFSGNAPEYKTILIADDLTKEYGASNQFVVRVLDENGNAVANKEINLNVGDKKLKAVTDSNGVAKFNIDLAVGKYDAVTYFDGDSVYGSKMITNKITVNKAVSKIVANKKTFKAKVKTKKYTVTLKANNKALNKVKVTIKVKGKTYKATTNTKGKATFKITKLTKKGKHSATVKFAGNGSYKASSKKVVITVK
jgi:hypothetical protein